MTPLKLLHAAAIGNELALVFSDDREVFLDFALLRRSCPCAVCQGEPDALGRVVRPTVEVAPKGFELRKYEMVGGYGLQLYWADGHSTGIYSFAYLCRLADLAAN